MSAVFQSQFSHKIGGCLRVMKFVLCTEYRIQYKEVQRRCSGKDDQTTLFKDARIGLCLTLDCHRTIHEMMITCFTEGLSCFPLAHATLLFSHHRCNRGHQQEQSSPITTDHFGEKMRVRGQISQCALAELLVRSSSL